MSADSPDRLATAEALNLDAIRGRGQLASALVFVLRQYFELSGLPDTADDEAVYENIRERLAELDRLRATEVTTDPDGTDNSDILTTPYPQNDPQQWVRGQAVAGLARNAYRGGNYGVRL